MAADPPIIITGGSITIEVDPGNFKPDGYGKHVNQQKRITRIEITGDGFAPINQTINNGRCIIKIHYSTP